MTKQDLREWARARRAGTVNTDGVLGRLTALAEWERARHVLLFLSMPGEIAVETLAATGGKRFYVPRCVSDRRLTIHPFVPGETPLVTKSWGLREPAPDAPHVAPETLDLVIVPGLCFDEHGNRLGYGAGYYDRFLPRLRAGCVTVGVATDETITPALPTEPHDIAVQIVVTPTRTFRLKDTTTPTPPPCSG